MSSNVLDVKTNLVEFDLRRRKALNWLRNNITADGEPVGAAVTNRWWRLPWALSVAGDNVTAAAVLGWAEREALTSEFTLKPGPLEFNPGASPIYELSAIAIGAWRLGRYALANRLLDACKNFQSSSAGGVYDRADAAGGHQEILKTAQLGLAAIVANRRDIADPVYHYFRTLWDAQPGPSTVLYANMDDSGTVVVPSDDDPLGRLFTYVDFDAPMQSYYQASIAGAFLYDYAALSGEKAAASLGRSFLSLNENGTMEQWTDPRSVQICKFAWGLSAALNYEFDAAYEEHAIRMGDWFVERQNDDGSWDPASFGRVVDLGPTDRLWKTGEHVMELSMVITALSQRHGYPRPKTDDH
ncbi:hypothetical protein [Rhodococcoides fascians]|uniref:hypothetical protein n=1 Tax=Rhodococcoides fascians TaxID=1828 RepID=UPI000A517169|nr:hypothetical protein [Rhodococcus fascians]